VALISLMMDKSLNSMIEQSKEKWCKNIAHAFSNRIGLYYITLETTWIAVKMQK
jgi:hypothetical protein